jgi:hypothetical protein
MRGHTRCRSHRDRELGPRGGGAPAGNLNALKTGDHTHPLPLLGLQRLVRQIARQPDQLPDHLHLVARSIHSRTGDPHKTLIAFRALLTDLIPQVARGRPSPSGQPIIESNESEKQVPVQEWL